MSTELMLFELRSFGLRWTLPIDDWSGASSDGGQEGHADRHGDQNIGRPSTPPDRSAAVIARHRLSDDTAVALPKRLQAYHDQTEPILDHYGPKTPAGLAGEAPSPRRARRRLGIVRRINANQTLAQVAVEVSSAIDGV